MYSVARPYTLHLRLPVRSHYAATSRRSYAANASDSTYAANVPTHDAPAPWQRGVQALGFVLAGVAGGYAVLFYDFEQENHCFQPIRQRYAALKQQFLTLPEGDPSLVEREPAGVAKSQKRLV